jgi:hypothetical protein
MMEKFPAINRAAAYSEQTLSRIREKLAAKQLGGEICVVATGSFGRREASGESDVDFFLLHTEKIVQKTVDALVPEVASWIKEIVERSPSPDGAFGEAESIENMLSNVGGPNDDNKKITRRMLLLLEGTYLANESLFESVRQQIIEMYLGERITTHAIARFLLNDVIRYYRTMCVDFEFKTKEQNKPWGIRYLKLLYSRKLLYFGGLVAVAETWELARQQKIDVLLERLRQTPIERVLNLFGADADEALKYYDRFLTKLSDETFRHEIAKVTPDRGTFTEEFTVLRDAAQHFTAALYRLMERRYSAGNPILLAIAF